MRFFIPLCGKAGDLMHLYKVDIVSKMVDSIEPYNTLPVPMLNAVLFRSWQSSVYINISSDDFCRLGTTSLVWRVFPLSWNNSSGLESFLVAVLLMDPSL